MQLTLERPTGRDSDNVYVNTLRCILVSTVLPAKKQLAWESLTSLSLIVSEIGWLNFLPLSLGSVNVE